MLFSEASFLFLFLPTVLLFYVLTPLRGRNVLLTVASLLFYASGEAAFLPVLLASVGLNYGFAIWIHRARGTGRASWILWAGIASDLGILAYFKYANFFVESVNGIAAFWRPGATAITCGRIALPLGISFFTFHKISYKVDVFRGHTAPKRNLLDLALYILFFPQLIAGPIVRYNAIAEQLDVNSRILVWERFSKGITIFIVGLSKKMLIANVLAAPADRIFGVPAAGLPWSAAWLGVVCYALQIYFDFSGYSDMAVGLACLFGFDFPKNFNYPYAADSVSDFWRRWHISLSTWFRDYLYIPLGGNRHSRGRTCLNLLAVFFLCGLWHGASWNFVVWGMFHGFFLVVERALGLRRAAGLLILRRLYLLLVVTVGWVFFRAVSLRESLHYLAAMSGLHRTQTSIPEMDGVMNRHVAIILLVGSLASTPLFRWTWRRGAHAGAMDAILFNSGVRWGGTFLVAALVVGLVLSLMEVLAGTYNPFIYFRF